MGEADAVWAPRIITGAGMVLVLFGLLVTYDAWSEDALRLQSSLQAMTPGVMIVGIGFILMALGFILRLMAAQPPSAGNDHHAQASSPVAEPPWPAQPGGR